MRLVGRVVLVAVGEEAEALLRLVKEVVRCRGLPPAPLCEELEEPTEEDGASWGMTSEATFGKSKREENDTFRWMEVFFAPLVGTWAMMRCV